MKIEFIKELKTKGVYDKLDEATKNYVDSLETTLNNWAEAQNKGLLDETTVKSLIAGEIAKVKALPETFDPAKIETDLKTLVEDWDGLQKEMKKYQPQTKEQKTFRTYLEEAFKEPEVEKQLKAILANNGRQSGPLNIEVKAAVTMGDFNTILAAGSASHYTLTSNTGIISVIRKRILRYLEGVSVGQLDVTKPYAMWIEELDEQGLPVFIGEAQSKTQLSVRYEERQKKSKKIGVYGKVTTEMMRFLPQLINYIQNNLIKRMDIKTEDQLFNGDDSGENLKGILRYATAFDGGIGVAGAGLVHEIHSPNVYDVMRAVALQVQNSYGDATRLFVTPDTIALMDVEKDDEGRYLIPPFKTANGTVVAGMELIPTLALIGTGSDFVGGDLSVVHVEFLYQTNIQIGLDGNDFTSNLKTILVEQELVQFVSANDTQVLVKGTFAAGIALLASAS